MALQDSAPDAPIAGLMAEKVDDVILVRTDQVHRGDRLRSVDPVWARALGTIMAREGQNTPIEVCRLPGRTEWELVAGAHRHAGAEFSGIEYLKAIVVSADRADRRMREISENLWRQGLDPIDRAAFIAELVTLKRSQAGLDVAAHRAASVADRFKKRIDDEADQTLETISSVYGWSDEVGAQIGLSGRSVRNDLMIFRGIAPSLIAKLREARHPVATNGTQLRALAKLDASEQQKAVWCLLNSDTIKSVGDAIAQVRGSNRAIDPAMKRIATIMGTLDRMSAAERLALFQLPQFHDVLPAEARRLLEPMLRAGAPESTSASVVAPGVPAVGSDAVQHPAVPIRASVKPDYLVCLECGEKHEMLKRHLSTHGLTSAEYLAKWRLPLDYPFIAPNTAEARRVQARKLGLQSGAKPGAAK